MEAVGAQLPGRDRELAVIVDALATADSGPPRCVHLVGEAGIGKTTIARRASSLAAGAGWTVAWGRAWDSPAAPPYLVWRQVLGAVVHQTPLLQHGHRPTLARLGDLVPEFASEEPDAAVPADDPARARADLHHAVLHALDTATATRPLALVLDDLHAAEVSTIELAILACRNPVRGRLLVLTTTRPTPDGSPQADSIGELIRQGTALPVRALSPRAVATLATRLLGRDLDDREVAALHAASGGNPFFVEQLVRWSPPDGRLLDDPEMPVTEPVRWLVRERLAALGADPRAVVDAAAVAGDVVDRSVLSAVVDWPSERFTSALRQAETAGILCHPPGEPARSTFVHALLREATAQLLAQDHRRSLHAELARALEALPMNPTRLAEGAYHRQQSLPLGDPAVMVDRTVDAARAAARVFAYAAVVDACDQALAALDAYRVDNQTRRWRCRLLLEQGDARFRAGDLDAGRETLLQAYTLAVDAGDASLAADAALRTPQRTNMLIADPELTVRVSSALAMLGDADPARRARLLGRLAVLEQDNSAARKHSQAALAIADDLGDAGVLAEVLSARVFALWSPETVHERLRAAERIVDLALRAGDLRRELDGRLWRFIALLELGRVVEAGFELGLYEQAAERTGQPEFGFYVRSRRATLATLRGDFAEGERLARRAHELAVEAGLPDADNALSAQLVFITQLAGGDHLIAEAVELDKHDRSRGIAAFAFLESGQWERARAMVPGGKMPPIPVDMIPGPVRLMNLAMFATGALRTSDTANARVLYDALLPHAGRCAIASGGMGYRGAVDGALGACALTLGDTATAVDHLRRAVEVDAAAGAVPFVARDRTMLAQALLLRRQPGDPAEAEQLIDAAEETASELGLPGVIREVTELRAALPVAGPDRPRLRRDGDDWTVSMAGRTARLRHSKGLAQLATLLDNPGRELSAVELAGGVDVTARDRVLDETAKRAYRRRLDELDQKLADADAGGDAEAGRRLSAERAALVAELKGAAGIGGRTRSFADDAEHARVNVTRTVRQAIDRIVVADPEIGAYLAATVITGMRCIYRPPT